jgi:hypothetical protein
MRRDEDARAITHFHARGTSGKREVMTIQLPTDVFDGPGIQKDKVNY